MRVHPMLRRLTARTDAAFRCAERLESREDLEGLFAPDLEAGPLVATERLQGLIAPADGSAALQRSLDRITAPPAGGGERAGMNRRPERLCIEALASSAFAEDSEEEVRTRRARPSPRTPRPESPPSRPAAARAAASPAPAPSRAQVQAILDRAARAVREVREPGAPRPGSPRGRSAAGGAAWIGASPASRPEAREEQASPAPGTSPWRGFLLDRAARTPLVIDDPEARLVVLLASSPASSSSPALPRAAVPADRARSLSPLPARSGAGGLRGLAALAEAEGLPSPPAPSSRFAAPPRGAEGGADLTTLEGIQRAPRARAAGFERPFAEPLASSTPLPPDLEAMLDQALRRAARRHGIEVLEP